MANQQQRKNGVENVLTPQQQHMREQVVDLELKARYWEAQWKIRHFTLEAEKIQPEYDAYIEEQRKINEELQEQMQARLKEINGLAEEGKVDVEAKEIAEPVNP